MLNIAKSTVVVARPATAALPNVATTFQVVSRLGLQSGNCV